MAADPLPERRAARLLAAFIGSGLIYLALPGTFLGVTNLLAIAAAKMPGAPPPAWIQAHGQAQVFGWVGSFILGISLYILPKFRGVALRPLWLGWVTWGVWTAGVAARWLAGLGYVGAHAGLIVGAGLMLAGFACSQYLLVISPLRQHERKERTGGMDAASLLGLAGFGGLAAALVVNLGAALTARTAAYAAGWDARVVELAIWAFIVPVAMGYSTRFVTVFAGLRVHRLEAGRPRLAVVLAFGVAALAAATLAGWMRAADLLALLLAMAGVWGLRVFEPGARAAKTAGVYAGYPAFLRLAFGWLIVGAGLVAASGFFPAWAGLPGAGRHAVTVGFIATLIFALGPRILSTFLNSRQLHSAGLMAASLWLLTLGCALRVASEAAAYGTQAGWAWRVLPVSAFIELGAVLLFVVNLALTLAQRPRAWFRAELLSGETLVYWCVASYPRTRRLLTRAGLKTLARTREIPRSLTLAEAAAADGAKVEGLLGALRGYFARHAPR
jgi:uncharacterized protein involved in response to NO